MNRGIGIGRLTCPSCPRSTRTATREFGPETLHGLSPRNGDPRPRGDGILVLPLREIYALRRIAVLVPGSRGKGHDGRRAVPNGRFCVRTVVLRIEVEGRTHGSHKRAFFVSSRTTGWVRVSAARQRVVAVFSGRRRRRALEGFRPRLREGRCLFSSTELGGWSDGDIHRSCHSLPGVG